MDREKSVEEFFQRVEKLHEKAIKMDLELKMSKEKHREEDEWLRQSIQSYLEQKQKDQQQNID